MDRHLIENFDLDKHLEELEQEGMRLCSEYSDVNDFAVFTSNPHNREIYKKYFKHQASLEHFLFMMYVYDRISEMKPDLNAFQITAMSMELMRNNTIRTKLIENFQSWWEKRQLKSVNTLNEK